MIPRIWRGVIAPSASRNISPVGEPCQAAAVPDQHWWLGRPTRSLSLPKCWYYVPTWYLASSCDYWLGE
jgi:hypothetical protein